VGLKGFVFENLHYLQLLKQGKALLFIQSDVLIVSTYFVFKQIYKSIKKNIYNMFLIINIFSKLNLRNKHKSVQTSCKVKQD